MKNLVLVVLLLGALIVSSAHAGQIVGMCKTPDGQSAMILGESKADIKKTCENLQEEVQKEMEVAKKTEAAICLEKISKKIGLDKAGSEESKRMLIKSGELICADEFLLSVYAGLQ